MRLGCHLELPTEQGMLVSYVWNKATRLRDAVSSSNTSQWNTGVPVLACG